MPASVSPPSAVNRTTASAPSTSASSTSAICTISGRSPSGDALADSSSASEVVGANASWATRIIPLLIMITFAPPATVSRVARRDVRERLEERRRGHPVVERADHRDARLVDHPLHPHRLAHAHRHVMSVLLPGPRRTTLNSNASARWCSSDRSSGSPSRAVVDLPQVQQQLAGLHARAACAMRLSARSGCDGHDAVARRAAVPLQDLVERTVDRHRRELGGRQRRVRRSRRARTPPAARQRFAPARARPPRRPARGRAPPRPRRRRPPRCGSRSASVPGRIPAARIASVTPKFTSRLFRRRGRCVAYVPAPRVRVTNPSSSSERRASRSVARDTPISSASSGSGGSFEPGADPPGRDPGHEFVADPERQATPASSSDHRTFV